MRYWKAMPPDATPRQPRGRENERARKQQVLTHGTASTSHQITDALVIKDRDLFFLCNPDGEVPIDSDHGLGLYLNDCRFLRGYELLLAGDTADRLASTAAEGNAMSIELTNPELRTSEREHVPRERVGLSSRREVDGERLTLHDRVRIENFGLDRAVFPLQLRLDAQFEDVFVVRGLLDDRPGELHPVRWDGDQLIFSYAGADNCDRSVTVTFDPPPATRDGASVGWTIELGPREAREISIELALAERRRNTDYGTNPHRVPQAIRDRGQGAGASEHGSAETSAGDRYIPIRSDTRLLNEIVARSLRDLQILRSDNAGAEYFAAGVPWFSALFGRDSVITSIEALAFDPSVAEQTLRVLAAWQGTEEDDYRDEEPGKILHELRVGELATTGAVPHHPFYGSVDATPLFCVLIAEHARWSGSLDVFRDLRNHVDAALAWIDERGDTDGDGFTDYRSSTGHGLVNQGWKDSGNGIVNADGSIVTPPVALVEVQGYVYAARCGLADLYERDGDAGRARQLRDQAEELRRRFEDRFWLADAGTYALALQRDGRPAAVVSSNAGHALWTGIAAQDRAAAVRDTLMGDEMFSGWGVRTLSASARRYNPIGYHLGTVWPHDNAICAAGLRRYGFDAEAHRIATAIVDAAAQFGEFRLPEVFAGYPRSRFNVPVHYPVACHPQAWAAGAVPMLLTMMLGLVPDAFGHELRVVRPALLDFVDWLEVRGLQVGDATCDLRFKRSASHIAVEVMDVRGHLEVVVEPAVGASSTQS
jgi:glycogen debranching enzyme